MKIAAKFDPKKLRCPSKAKAGWCYKVVRSKKQYIVQYRVREGLLVVGHLGADCRMTYGKPTTFKTREVADQAAQKCILYTRNPGGKDPSKIYRDR